MTILQLRRYQKRDADLDAVAASGVAAAWTTYTPTVTAGVGTFTTVSATGRYLVIGKLTFGQVDITITTNGTAATFVGASLPNSSAAIYSYSGREFSVTGKAVQAYTTGALLVIFNYDGTYPGGSGYRIRLAGCYEAA